MYEVKDPVIKEFLASIERKSTYNCYKTFLKLYLEWSGKTGQQLLDDKKNDKDATVEKSLLLFRKWILDSGKSTNYASSSVGAIGGFYSYNRTPLTFIRSESKKLRQRERTTQDYHFEKDDFEKMAKYANLKEKYVLFLGKSTGLRASDFLKLTYGHFRSAKLDSEAPVALGEFVTHKQTEKAFPFLDTDALQIVKDFLEVNKSKLDSELVLDDTEDNLSLMLQKLAKKSGMEIEGVAIHGKRVRFHCMRKFLSERLSAHSSENQWKQIVGKAIGEGAYISQDQLRAVYAKAMKDITINGNGIKVKKLMELENALLESQKRLTNIEVTNEVLRKELNNVNVEQQKDKQELLKQISSMYAFVHKNLDPLLEMIDELSKMPEGAELLKKMQTKKQEAIEEE
jgi:hypothetical protein